MVKLLAELVNYGNEQLSYLQQVVNELKSFHHFDVTIIVNSNIELDIEGIDHVNIIELDDYQLLPLTCRETIWDYRFDYEVFLFGENDHFQSQIPKIFRSAEKPHKKAPLIKFSPQ